MCLRWPIYRVLRLFADASSYRRFLGVASAVRPGAVVPMLASVPRPSGLELLVSLDHGGAAAGARKGNMPMQVTLTTWRNLDFADSLVYQWQHVVWALQCAEAMNLG